MKVVARVARSHGDSQRRACSLTRQHRSAQRKPSRRDPRLDVRQRMREIAAARVRHGCRRLHVLLRREGWTPGRNVARRLGREERAGTARQAAPAAREGGAARDAVQADTLNEAWSLDVIHAPLSSGAKLRALTGVDAFSREELAIEVGQRLKAGRVVGVLNRLVGQRRAPRRLFADDGSECTEHLVDLWACQHKVRIDFSRPGKPTDNALIETFNGSLRDERLNLHGFKTVAEARVTIEAWRRDDNESRPHRALGHRTPQEHRLLTGASPPGTVPAAAESQRRTRTTKAKRLRSCRTDTLLGPLNGGLSPQPAGSQVHGTAIESSLAGRQE